MDESILISIKAALGLTTSYLPFDSEIIMHINSFLRAVNQFGIGNPDLVIDQSTFHTWTDFLGEDKDAYTMVKSYLTLKVRMVFDPPTSSIVTQALKETVQELEWRLIEIADAKKAGETNAL